MFVSKTIRRGFESLTSCQFNAEQRVLREPRKNDCALPTVAQRVTPMRRFFAALALSAVAAFGVHAQARQAQPKVSEYNFTGCGSQSFIAQHGVLAADGTTLSFTYFRHGDVVEKNEGANLVVLKGQTSDVLKNGERKFDGVGQIPSSKDPSGKVTVVAHGKIYKNRFAVVIYRGDDLLFAMYGYLGPVDDLVKLDQSEAEFVCQMARMVGAENIPDLLNQWLHQDDAPEQPVSKS